MNKGCILGVGERVELYISGQRGKIAGHGTYQSNNGVCFGYIVELDKALTLTNGLMISHMVIHQDAVRQIRNV